MEIMKLFATIAFKDDGFTKGIEQTGKSVSEVRSEIMKLASAYEKEGMTKSDALKRAHSELSSEMDKAKKSAGGVGNEAKTMGEKFGDAAQKVGGFALKVGEVLVKATLAAGAALLALGVAATKIGMDFESEMSNLAAITGMTTDEMKQMDEGIRQISKNTGMSLMDIAKNAKMVAESGGDINTMMSQLEQGTNLAIATQSNMATTLDFLGSTMKTFGIEAHDTQEVVDSFALVTSLANLELGQLAEAYVNTGGSAAMAGMSIHDVNAVMIEFANAGLKGGAAGTALNRMLADLATPTDKAAKELNNLGVQLYDNYGNTRNLFDVMGDLEHALSGMDNESRRAAEATIFNTVALKGWDIITNESVKSIRDLSGELSNASSTFGGVGQAAGMVSIQVDNLKGKLSILKAGVQDLGIQFYKSIDMDLKEAVDLGTGYVKRLSEAFSKEGLAGAISQIGDILADIVIKITEKLPQFIQIGVDLIKALVEGISANSGLIAQSAAETIKVFTTGILEILPTIFDAGLKIILEFAAAMGNALPELIPVAVEAILTMVTSLLNNVDKMAEAAAAIVTGLAVGIINSLPVLVEKAPEILMALIKGIASALSMLAEVPQLIVKAIADGIINNLPVLDGPVAGILKHIISIITKIMKGDIIGAGKEVVSMFKDGIDTGSSDAKTAGENIVDNFVSGIDATSYKSGTGGIKVSDDFINGLYGGAEAAEKAGEEVIAKYVNGIDVSNFKVHDGANRSVIAAKQAFLDRQNEFSELGKQTIDNVATGMNSGVGNVTNSMHTVGNYAKKELNNTANEMPTIGGAIVDGVWQGVQRNESSFAQNIKTFFTNIVNSAKSALGISSPSKIFAGIGINIGEGFIDGLESMENKIDSTMDDIFGDMERKIDISPNISAGATIANGQTQGRTAGGTNININFYDTKIDNDLDIEYVAQQLARRTDNAIRGMGLQPA